MFLKSFPKQAQHHILFVVVIVDYGFLTQHVNGGWERARLVPRVKILFAEQHVLFPSNLVLPSIIAKFTFRFTPTLVPGSTLHRVGLNQWHHRSFVERGG